MVVVLRSVLAPVPAARIVEPVAWLTTKPDDWRVTGCAEPIGLVGWAEGRRGVGTLRRMKMLRRALVALSFAGTIAGVLRLRGKGGVPPQEGGWREVSVPPK